MNKPLIATALTVMSASVAISSGQSLTINTQNTFIGFTNALLDENGTALMSGDLVQLGFFDPASAPDTDAQSSFSNFTAVGDPLAIGTGGSFAETVMLTTADLPAGTPQTLQFGIRFFNDSSESTSTFFNTITSPNWEFSFSSATPPPTPSELILDPTLLTADTLQSIIYESGAPPVDEFGNRLLNLSTQVTVPEPSSSITILLGAGLLLGARRRK